MKPPSLRLLAAIVLLAPVAVPASAAAPQEPMPGSPVEVVPIRAAGEPLAAPEGVQAGQLLDEHELAELAALEAGSVELQDQKAGFFGPRIGTIIVIALVLILVL